MVPKWFRSSASQLTRSSSSGSRTLATPELLSLETTVDEERIPGYQSDHYFPANPGDIIQSRYQLEVKIGWGSTSTVWLARDLQSGGWFRPGKHVAVKICNCDTAEEDTHELDINVHLSSASPNYRGRGVLGTAMEGHTITSPRGLKHLALIFPPLREPLWLLGRRITHHNHVTHEALPLMKLYFKILLEGLDYMHTQAHVIHTDLKLDNIMVTFEDPSTIEAFVRAQTSHPMARKNVGDRVVYRCHNDFGPIAHGLGNMVPQITDFGLAQRGDNLAGSLVHPIQPNGFRAPEVLLGIGWSYSADIWNFGAMIWDFLKGSALFAQPRAMPYSPSQHLADMCALLGDVPPLLIQRERDIRHLRWNPAVLNPGGKLSSNAAEFYGGPFFNDEGSFIYKNLVPTGRTLEDEVPQCILEDKHIDLFLNFMRRMLCWIPEERATARDLLDDPWLNCS